MNYAEKYIDYCRREKRLSEYTVKAYRIDLRQFGNFMKDCGREAYLPEQMDRQLLQDYIAEMNSHYTARSVKRKIASLRCFLSWLEEEDLLTLNPFHKLKVRIREPFRLPNAMTLEEVRQILEAAYEDGMHFRRHTFGDLTEFLHYRDILVLEALFASGVRVQELCNVQYNDVDFYNQTVRIVGKGNKERLVYVGNDAMRNAYQKYDRSRRKLEFESKFVFLNKFGRKLSTQSARNIVKKYASLAGIHRKITPHSFRHTFASLLLEEGVDLRFIQQYLGHSSISTTQIYLHVADQKALELLAEHHPRQKIDLLGRKLL